MSELPLLIKAERRNPSHESYEIFWREPLEKQADGVQVRLQAKVDSLEAFQVEVQFVGEYYQRFQGLEPKEWAEIAASILQSQIEASLYKPFVAVVAKESGLMHLSYHKCISPD